MKPSNRIGELLRQFLLSRLAIGHRASDGRMSRHDIALVQNLSVQAGSNIRNQRSYQHFSVSISTCRVNRNEGNIMSLMRRQTLDGQSPGDSTGN